MHTEYDDTQDRGIPLGSAANSQVANGDSETEWTEEDWNSLLGYVAGGNVIPVIGQELLWVDMGDGRMNIAELLAKQLGERLGIDKSRLCRVAGKDGASRPLTLHDVACLYLETPGRRLDRLYQYVSEILTTAQFPIPRALTQLAEITDFSLYVTTTVDPLLESALNAARFAGRRETVALAFQPKKKAGLPKPFGEITMPTVFYMLGQAVPARGAPTPSSFVLSEEDLVEFIYGLRPENANDSLDRLFQAMGENYLLILGGGFSDWVTRFLLRIAKGSRLFNAEGIGEFVAESCDSESNLVLFLKRFRQQSVFYRHGAQRFVDELWLRWMARKTALPASAPMGVPPPAEMPEGAVFISYTWEDLQAVQRLKAGLDAAGVPAWFDREQLKAAHVWEQKIRDNIARCSFFIPVVSQQTERKLEGYFRTEWALGAERATRFFGCDENFLLPVSIDDTTTKSARRVPTIFNTAQWESLPGGEMRPEWAARVRTLIVGRSPKTEGK
jgi:hypothetical protein